MDPAGVLVAEDVGQLDAGLLGPLALLHVQVGAAQPGAADRTMTSCGPVIAGSAICSTFKGLVVLVQARGDHAAPSPRRIGDAVADAAAASGRCPPLLSRLRPHEARAAQPPRQVLGRDGRCRRRRRAPGRRRRWGRPSCARSDQQRRGVRRSGGQVGDAQGHASAGSSPPPAARRTRGPGGRAAPCAGTACAARRARPSSRRGTRRRTRAAARQRGVDLRGRCSGRRGRPSTSRTPGTRGDRASRASATMRKAKFGAHWRRGQAQVHATSPPADDDARADEARASVIGSSSSGSMTAASAASACACGVSQRPPRAARRRGAAGVPASGAAAARRAPRCRRAWPR